MKKIFLLITVTLLLTGCFKDKSEEAIDIDDLGNLDSEESNKSEPVSPSDLLKKVRYLI